MTTIKRYEAWKMFDAHWCPNCGKKSEFEYIRTGLPGIQQRRCKVCDHYFGCNFLENDDDILEVPDNFKRMPENYCVVCEKETEFIKVSSDDPSFTRTGDKCLGCQNIFLPDKDNPHKSIDPKHGKYDLFNEKCIR